MWKIICIGILLIVVGGLLVKLYIYGARLGWGEFEVGDVVVATLALVGNIGLIVALAYICDVL